MQAWEAVCRPGAETRIASFTSISGPNLDHVGHWVRRTLARPSPAGVAGLLAQAASSSYVPFLVSPLAPPLLGILAPGRGSGLRYYRGNLRGARAAPATSPPPSPSSSSRSPATSPSARPPSPPATRGRSRWNDATCPTATGSSGAGPTWWPTRSPASCNGTTRAHPPDETFHDGGAGRACRGGARGYGAVQPDPSPTPARPESNEEPG